MTNPTAAQRLGRLVLICGPNGAGKTSVARTLTAQRRGLHIAIDAFSAMQRGRAWHTRANCREKIELVLGALDAALKATRRRTFFVEGVLLYRFMFEALQHWCDRHEISFHVVKLIGQVDLLTIRTTRRSLARKNWNALLPEYYQRFRYPGMATLDTSDLDVDDVASAVTAICKLDRSRESPRSDDQFSFGMLKPDCLRRDLTHEAFRRIEQTGLAVIAHRRVRLDDEGFQVLYGHLTARPHLTEIRDYLFQSEVIVFIAYGRDAIRRLNHVCGATDPLSAKPGTLRELGRNVQQNIAHSAADRGGVLRSADHFFADWHRRASFGLTANITRGALVA